MSYLSLQSDMADCSGGGIHGIYQHKIECLPQRYLYLPEHCLLFPINHTNWEGLSNLLHLLFSSSSSSSPLLFFCCTLVSISLVPASREGGAVTPKSTTVKMGITNLNLALDHISWTQWGKTLGKYSIVWPLAWWKYFHYLMKMKHFVTPIKIC